MNETCKTDGKCCCPCHMMLGILITLFGLLFLLGHFEVLSASIVGAAWPVLVMLGGIKTAMAGKCKCCDKA